jgi:nucleoside-diphosphate-sugar epimerase
LAAYTSSNLAAESFGLLYWGSYSVDFVAVRLSAVYGLEMQYPMYIKPMVENALLGLPSTFPAGADMARDYTYINDVVTGILLVLDYQKPFDY